MPSAKYRRDMESAKNRMLVLVAFDELSNFGTGYNRFDEYDVSLVQEQKAALRACPAKEKRPGSIGKPVRKPSSGSRVVMFIFGRNFFMRSE
jgi:hypothetical protein